MVAHVFAVVFVGTGVGIVALVGITTAGVEVTFIDGVGIVGGDAGCVVFAAVVPLVAWVVGRIGAVVACAI